MDELEKRIIQLGIIDNSLTTIEVGNWFDTATISFRGNDDIGMVTIEFVNCFEISLKHDRSYSKGKKVDGDLNYNYFIQDIEVNELKGFLEFKISGWPLEGEIVCKNIELHSEK